MSRGLARRIAGPLAGAVRLLAGVSAQAAPGAVAPGPRVYFANHTSHLDFVVLWSVLPPELRALTRPVAARDYWQAGVRRFLAAEVFRAVLVDRAAPSVEEKARQVDAMAQVLGEGESLIIFPEGTRGPGGPPAPFKSGLWHLARRCPHVPLVPVGLENLGRILPKGEMTPVPLLSRARFGEPLFLGVDEPKEPFLARAHAAVAQLLEPPTRKEPQSP